MPSNGQLLTNSITGDTYEYLETSKDSDGARVVIKATVKSRGQLVPNHFHTVQDETFEVIDGQLTVWVDGAARVLSAGERITLPKNKPHNHYNGHSIPVTYLHTVTPGLDFDYLIENLVGLATDGKKGGGGLLQQLVTLRYLDSKSFLADIPLTVQKVLMTTIAPIARLLGYRAIYKRYSGVEK
ncbi:cupin domain-containing protein [Parapedobacter sp. 2B3]|uniref:cupin domain-containing protein n=1 Tax=Parapedobacter sp. 2B3 TaxID=3342381 RepID=UPI0035B57239